MVKNSDNTILISGLELDQIMLHLESAFCNTGDPSIFQVIDILMSDTHKEIILCSMT